MTFDEAVDDARSRHNTDVPPGVDAAYLLHRSAWRELGMKPVHLSGTTVVVPRRFVEWGRQQQAGYLAQRRVFAAEGEMVSFAFESVRLAERASGESDPWETAASVLSAAMALSRHAASRLVATAVELCERLPRTAALLAAGWIGLTSAHLIAGETRIVDDDKVDALDKMISEHLAPTRRRTHAPRLGPLRKMLGKAISACDPVGAAARARESRAQTEVHLDPIGNDMSVLNATVPVDVGVELMDRIEAMARTAADGDPRTIGQLRAAGLLALCRGWTSLPDPEGGLAGDPRAESTARRVVIHTYEVDGVVSVAGYGPVTDATAADLARTSVRRVEKISDLADRSRFSSIRYAPSEALRAFCRGRDGTCVFPGCQIAAERCDLDHIVPFDHNDPEHGGQTTSDNLGDLCRSHHGLKTEGIWSYYRGDDGSYVWVHGPNHPGRDPGTRIRVEPNGPLAQYGAPHDPESTARQRAAVDDGRTGSAPRSTWKARQHPHLRDRRRAERQRLRAAAWMGMETRETTGPGTVSSCGEVPTADATGRTGHVPETVAYEDPPF